MDWKMNLFIFLFIFSLEFTRTISITKCEDFVTCSTCVINAVDDCLWCSGENYTGKRCQPRNLVNETWCKNPISKPEVKLIRTADKNFSAGENGTGIVQFKPQQASIKSATPGASVDIEMYYKPAKDAPLDIYFLIDNSGNIAQYRSNLINQIKPFLEGIKNYTNNVALGVGTFVEKPVMPYSNPDMQSVYSFKNHLSLTNDSDVFINTLTDIQPSQNYDLPENLLDGLMQTMLCQTQINWRNDSRRIIVTYTNAFYHAAGDGKFIGAFKRHNMECYKNDSMYTIMDYPSVPQVNKVVKDNGFIIIFVANANDTINYIGDVQYYKLLSESIYGSRFAKLTDGNIGKIIKEEYIKIIEDVNIETVSSSNVQVTITKTCPDCKALHFSSPLKFVATIKVISCNPTKGKEIIKITPMSLKKSLEVEVEFECQCECEKDQLKEINSKKCNGEGDYQCGICKCKPDRFGDDCMCKRDSMNDRDDYYKCRKNRNEALSCSGHGECSCGKCISCHEGFSGPFCEYDVNACPRPGGKVCSGHGNCEMGLCQCDPNWVHSLNGIGDCGCTLEQKSCIAPHSKKVCSGNGVCDCGKCVCTSKENSNDTCSGRYCDKCSWFTAKRCEELEDYAYCRFLNKTSCQDNYNLTDTTVFFANRTEINSPDNIEWYMANLCRVKKGDDESIFVFKYYYTTVTDAGSGANDTMLTLVIQNELDEKPPANIWVPVGSAIGGILLIGLLTLLLWKVLTDYYDEREYNKFAENAKAAGYNVTMTENPWYEPPTTTFINPAHDPSHTDTKK